MKPTLNRLRTAITNACAHLHALRGDGDHWEGFLSSSALSTATAVCAIQAAARIGRIDAQSAESLVHGGRAWLRDNQNPDGGWGDTTRSHSNISTTVLCWAALAGCTANFQEAEQRAEHWIQRTAGSLEPAILAEAIRQRYGKDRTFSVPILTALALHGRLGSSQQAWGEIPQLPFELAAFPRRWFAAMKLPVVSYALPALIAMGHARHRHRPTWNPVTRVIRNLLKPRTREVLREIQPQGGGYLEATPLTSFVIMSLIGAGEDTCPVIEPGLDFLIGSVREDGSWPIDTHLATWVTTLAVNALSNNAEASQTLDAQTIQRITQWLLAQQYRQVHPYTMAAPGGWSWTPLSGGVPDADDTPGALIALANLRRGTDTVSDSVEQTMLQSVRVGVRWLLDLQNRDGGIPTFCKGWGALPFDRSSPDLTAHTLRAWALWYDHLPEYQAELKSACSKACRYLASTQTTGSGWYPLWFGNQDSSAENNLTYGTSRVVLALTALQNHALGQLASVPAIEPVLQGLMHLQNEDGGFGGGVGTPSTIEETALAVEALSAGCSTVHGSGTSTDDGAAVIAVIERAVDWLLSATREGTRFQASPIGFYFAKLWYYEEMYPLVFSLAAWGRAEKLLAQHATNLTRAEVRA